MIAHPASGPGSELAPVMAHAAPAAVTGTALPLVMTLLFVVAALSAFAYWRQRRGNDSDDGGSGPGWGGPQQHRPSDDGPAGDEFPWWPEFERRFGDYLKRRGQDGSGPRRLPDAFSRTTLRRDRSPEPVSAASETSTKWVAPTQAGLYLNHLSRVVPGVVVNGGYPPPARCFRHDPEAVLQFSRAFRRPASA
jgi:hypothetical protein